jgi:hypothetical protein
MRRIGITMASNWGTHFIGFRIEGCIGNQNIDPAEGGVCRSVDRVGLVGEVATNVFCAAAPLHADFSDYSLKLISTAGGNDHVRALGSEAFSNGSAEAST